MRVVAVSTADRGVTPLSCTKISRLISENNQGTCALIFADWVPARSPDQPGRLASCSSFFSEKYMPFMCKGGLHNSNFLV